MKILTKIRYVIQIFVWCINTCSQISTLTNKIASLVTMKIASALVLLCPKSHMLIWNYFPELLAQGGRRRVVNAKQYMIHGENTLLVKIWPQLDLFTHNIINAGKWSNSAKYGWISNWVATPATWLTHSLPQFLGISAGSDKPGGTPMGFSLCRAPLSPGSASH